MVLRASYTWVAAEGTARSSTHISMCFDGCIYITDRFLSCIASCNLHTRRLSKINKSNPRNKELRVAVISYYPALSMHGRWALFLSFSPPFLLFLWYSVAPPRNWCVLLIVFMGLHIVTWPDYFGNKMLKFSFFLFKLFQFFGLIIIQTIWVKAIKFYIYILSEKSNMGIFFSLFNWTGQKVKSIYLFIFKGCFHLHCFMDGLANATGAASHTHKKWSRELTSLFTENAAFKKNFFLAILHNL